MEAAQLDANDAMTDSQTAFESSTEAKNTAETARNQIQELLDEITYFLSKEVAEPEDIRKVEKHHLSLILS